MRQARKERAKTKKETGSRIPVFKTIEEEAEFWDTHSTTEFEDEFELVTDVMFVPVGPRRAITIRLDERSYAQLAGRAREEGTRPTTLAHFWILQQLRERR